MGNKRFELLLMKNTLAIVIPAVVVLAVFMFMFIKYPLLEQLRAVNLDSYEELGDGVHDLYEEGRTNVEYTAKNMNYTGFDYYVDGKMKGAYYYSMEEKYLQLYLISTEKPQEYIEELAFKGKLVKDAVAAGHIMKQLSEYNEFEDSLLEDYYSPYIISEPDYPYAYITMVYVFFYMPIIICVLILAYGFLVWFNPAIHSQAKQLACYGNISDVISELSGQLKYHMLYRKNNIYITSDYLIVSYLTRTDVIKIANIKYLSKNEIDRRVPGHRNKRLYRLTVSDPEVLYYEVDFLSEELADDVISYIKGVNNNVIS